MTSTRDQSSQHQQQLRGPLASNARSAVVIVLMCVFFAIGLMQLKPTSAQQAPSETLTVAALITEMRALRQSLDNLASNNLRTQLALERWRAQQTIVERAVEAVRDIQDQLEAERATLQQTEQSAKHYEKLLAAESDAAQRGVIERELQAALANIEQAKQRIQQLQEREAQANAHLQSERAKAQERQEALDLLDHAFNQITPRNR